MDVVLTVTWNQPWPGSQPVFAVVQDATEPSRSSSGQMQFEAAVEGKSADILYLFSEPKLLRMNPPSSQSLILPPISSKNTPTCRSGPSHPSMRVRVASTNHSILSGTFSFLFFFPCHTCPFTAHHRGARFRSPSLAHCLVDGCLEVGARVGVAGGGR